MKISTPVRQGCSSTKLSVITVGFNNCPEIKKTCESVDRQAVAVWEHVIVASGLSQLGIADLKSIANAPYRRFLFNQDKSIYNAMNIGLLEASGDAILFLNSGDVFLSEASTGSICRQYRGKCIAFATVQVDGCNRYRRGPGRIEISGLVGAGHQGFVAPLPRLACERIRYDESNAIGADQDWIANCARRYGVELASEPIALFELGGLSSRPSLRGFWLRLKSGRYSSALKVLPKMVVWSLFGRSIYYQLLAKLRNYTKYEGVE